VIALEIARLGLLRTLRDRTSLFFVFVLPIVLVLVLGLAYGGFGSSRLGVVSAGSGPLGEELVNAIEAGDLAFELRTYGSVEEMQAAVEEGLVELGLVVPADYDARLRAGQRAEIVLLAQSETSLSALRQGVEAAVAREAARVRAARVASAETGLPFDAALERAVELQSVLPGVSVVQRSVGVATFPSSAGPFALGAQSQTILFMFLTSMTAATQLVLTRQLGVSRRMLATPTRVRSILLGELLGRFAVAMLQGVFIVLVSALLFGVAWGDLPAASGVIVAFALIGTGTALIIGVFAGNPDQAGSIGVVVGMALGALGGAMVPLEMFDEPMSTLAHLTPHAWAVEALREVAFRGAGLAGIVPQLAVLSAMALGLVAVGTWGLRRSLTRP
jgi:ABC-2 type transport system permease protein